MKRLIFLMLALLVAGSASAATKVQVMTDGVIDVDRLPTISFFQETDPSLPTLALASTAPGKLKGVQTWKKANVTKREIDKY